jgi:hypothetical protein
MNGETRNPWDREPNEPAMWYGRFTAYRMMGTERTMLGAYNAWRATKGRKPTTTYTDTWQKRAKEFRWKERAEAWDAAERERRDALRREDEEAVREEWRDKARAAREQQYEVGMKLIEKATQMLAFPLAQVKSEDGKTLILPAKWSFGTAGTLVNTAGKLLQLATGEVLDGVEVTQEVQTPDGSTVRSVTRIVVNLPADALETDDEP